MDTEILGNARADRERLAERLSEVQGEMAELQERLGEIDAFVKMWNIYAKPVPGTPLPGQPPLADLRKMTIADGAASILRSMGGQAKAIEIVAMLRKSGKMNGKGDYGSLIQTIQRFPERFEKVRPGVWRLVETLPVNPAVVPISQMLRDMDSITHNASVKVLTR